VGELDRKRWRIEGACHQLSQTLQSEINALGYPPAALLGFCVGPMSFNLFANEGETEAKENSHGRPTRHAEREDGGTKGDACGYDAGKKIAGRKRHLLVDPDGLLLSCVVHGADVQDRDGARLVLRRLT
jgi:hypothetical protein